jgi:hypothetical protein
MARTRKYYLKNNYLTNKSNKAVHGQIVRICMTIRRCVAYHNDLPGTLTFDLNVK